MFARLIGWPLCIALIVGVATGHETKSRSEDAIRKDLEKAQQKVIELEAELASVVDQKPQLLPDDKFKVGAVYNLFDSQGVGVAVKAVKVLGPNEVLAEFVSGQTTWPMRFSMRMPTAGIAAGTYIQDALDSPWKLTGTKSVLGQQVYVLESAGRPAPKKEHTTGGKPVEADGVEAERAGLEKGGRKPAMAGDGVGVRVVSAVWGAGDRQADVTDVVAGLVARGKTVVVNTPDLGPDPAPNVNKVLKVKLRVGDQLLILSAPDRGELQLSNAAK